MYFKKETSGYAATPKLVKVANKDVTVFTVAKQLDLAEDADEFSTMKTGITVSNTEFKSSAGASEFSFSFTRKVRSVDPDYLMIEGKYLTQASW
jgi:hypothetical protein